MTALTFGPAQRIATERIVIVGAGMGGLAAAISAAAQGLQVTLVERAAAERCARWTWAARCWTPAPRSSP